MCDENESILSFPFLANVRALDALGTKFTFQHGGYLAAGFSYRDNRYL